MANAIKGALPNSEVILREDHQHVPYGTKQPKQILGFIMPIFNDLVNEGCDVIVIACNTVSTTLIGELRKQYAVPLIAVEPMVKLAAKLTRSGVVTVCATPTTLSSGRYQYLKARYAKNLKVLEPDCQDWSQMIEQKQVDEEKIRSRIAETLSQHSDVIVLGCTHYHWIEREIKAIVDNRAQVIQPEPIIIGQLSNLLTQI